MQTECPNKDIRHSDFQGLPTAAGLPPPASASGVGILSTQDQDSHVRDSRAQSVHCQRSQGQGLLQGLPAAAALPPPSRACTLAHLSTTAEGIAEAPTLELTAGDGVLKTGEGLVELDVDWVADDDTAVDDMFDTTAGVAAGGAEGDVLKAGEGLLLELDVDWVAANDTAVDDMIDTTADGSFD